MTRPEILAAIAALPRHFGLRAFPGDVFRVSHESSFIGDDGVVRLYTERRKADGTWVCFAKGTLAELRAQVTEVRS